MKEKLTLTDIRKVYGTESDRSVTALHDLTLNVREGEFLCVLGKTGCGKTTLLRILAGLEIPTEGKLQVNGHKDSDLTKVCSLVFQQYSLFPWLNILQNTAFPLELKGIGKAGRIAKAEELLKLVGLSEYKESKPFELSGGMQQRVAIARALAYDPEILLMDEPFGALDEKTRQLLQDLLLDIWEKKQKTIVFVTHNIDEAILLADRIVVMSSDPGRVVKEIDVPFPRPRNKLDEKFSRLYLDLRETLEMSQ